VRKGKLQSELRRRIDRKRGNAHQAAFLSLERLKPLSRGLSRYSGVLGAVVFISLGSKALGFVREVFISSHFGVSAITDVFFGVQQVPVVLTAYVMGAVPLVYIPFYVHAKENGRARQFVLASLKLMLLAGVAMSLFMILGARSWMPAIIGVHHSDELVAKYSWLMSFSVPPSLCYGLSYCVCHAEGAHGKAFAIAASAPAGMLASLLAWQWIAPGQMLYAMPGSFVIGSCIAAAWSLLDLQRTIKLSPPPQVAANQVKMAKGFTGQLVATSIENVGANFNSMMTVHFSGETGTGGIGINLYAYRIAMLPLSGIVGPLNQIVQSWLAKKPAASQHRMFSMVALAAGCLYGILALILVMVRHPLTMMIYHRGAFTDLDGLHVAATLLPYSIYFFITAMNQLFARYFFVCRLGQIYAAFMVSGYTIETCIRFALHGRYGVSGVIFSAVVGEGLSLLASFLWFVHAGIGSGTDLLTSPNSRQE
jgi:putative peptidoglycan lipid II flippase